MREPGSHATLGEILGSTSTEGMKLSNLKDILGEKMPDLPMNAVGRFRLVKALQQRFGSGFRSIPGVSNIIKDFDEEVSFSDTVARMGKIKPQKKER